jgi:hypothetical protein
MGIYEKIFIDNFRNSIYDLKPTRLKSINFMVILQLGHFFLVFAPLGFFKLFNGPKQDFYSLWGIVLFITILNLLYFNKSRLNFLTIEYDSMSNKKRKQIGYLSLFISATTFVADIGILAYKTYTNFKF